MTTNDDWRLAGACGRYNPDWWTPLNVGSLEAQWATWVCNRECPVRPLCEKWAEANAQLCSGSIYAGTLYTSASGGSDRRVRPSSFQPGSRPPHTRPHPRGLDARVDELRELAATSLGLREIAERIGGYSHEAIRAAMRRHGIERSAA